MRNRYAPASSSFLLEDNLDRRKFLGRSASAAALLAASRLPLHSKSIIPPSRPLGAGKNAPFDHVVVVTMENRSFDHFLGWLPGADGWQQGLSYPDPYGQMVSTYPLAPDYQGCDHPGPDHSYEGGRVQYDGGACDGWLLAENSDEFAIGYYRAEDLPFYAQATRRFGTCDQYFAAIMAGTWPNKIYQWCAQTDRLTNDLWECELPTIFDRLAQRGLSGRYYFSDVPFSILWGTRYLDITHPIEQFYADCATGTLPAVSYVDPRFLGEEIGLTNDDHPHADIRNGQEFLNSIYNAVATSPLWSRTVLVINYDEWGGFFDHVPPSKALRPPADIAAGSDGLRGFRVPAMIVSPFTGQGMVHHQLFDHNSVLCMIERRWQLAPLTVRDATANDLSITFDYDQPLASPPQFLVPEGPFGELCLPGPAVPNEWDRLAELALQMRIYD